MKLPKVSWRGLAIGAVLVLILVPTFARNIGRISSPGIPPIKEWFSDLGLDTPGKLLLVVLLAIVAFHWRKPLGGIIAGALLLLILLFLLNWTGLIMSPGVTKWRQEAGNLPQQTEVVTTTLSVPAPAVCDGVERTKDLLPGELFYIPEGCTADVHFQANSVADCYGTLTNDVGSTGPEVCKDTPEGTPMPRVTYLLGEEEVACLTIRLYPM